MKTATYTIKGTTAMMMHSERLANPFDPLTKEIKAISGTRRRTEDQLHEMARLEWLGGLYYNEHDGIHLPGYNVLACIVGGGKIHKLGTAVKRSALVVEDAIRVEFDGPKTPEKLFANAKFVDMRSVKIGTSKVMRCRPVFPEWQLTFRVAYDENSIQRADLDRCVETAGQMVGLGDYRPRFGRFEVTANA